jgi:hypothetical protein
MRKTFALVAGVVLLLTSQASAAVAQTSGAQRMMIESREGTATRVEATGAITDRGTVVDTLVLDPLTGIFSNHAVMTLSAGTLSFEDAGIAQLTLDPRTCVGQGHFVAPFNVTGGTGAYANASGSGTVIGDLTFIFDRTANGCSQFPVRSWGIARATGDLVVP